MIKVISEFDIRNASNIERCRLLIAIIRRRSGIYSRYKNSLKEWKNMDITNETRAESYKKIELKKKSKLIYENLGNGEYTARELAIKMHNLFDEDGNRLLRTAERQETAPRLTELVELGLVKVVGKKYDKISYCNVAVYKKI